MKTGTKILFVTAAGVIALAGAYAVDAGYILNGDGYVADPNWRVETNFKMNEIYNNEMKEEQALGKVEKIYIYGISSKNLGELNTQRSEGFSNTRFWTTEIGSRPNQTYGIEGNKMLLLYSLVPMEEYSQSGLNSKLVKLGELENPMFIVQGRFGGMYASYVTDKIPKVREDSESIIMPIVDDSTKIYLGFNSSTKKYFLASKERTDEIEAETDSILKILGIYDKATAFRMVTSEDFETLNQSMDLNLALNDRGGLVQQYIDSYKTITGEDLSINAELPDEPQNEKGTTMYVYGRHLYETNDEGFDTTNPDGLICWWAAGMGGTLNDYQDSIYLSFNELSNDELAANKLIGLGKLNVPYYYVSENINGKEMIYVSDDPHAPGVTPLGPVSWDEAAVYLVKNKATGGFEVVSYDESKSDAYILIDICLRDIVKKAGLGIDPATVDHDFARSGGQTPFIDVLNASIETTPGR